MRKSHQHQLDFEVDKLTNSIENSLTGEICSTRIVRLRKEDVGTLRKTKWVFDWKREIEDAEREVHALTTMTDPLVWQGLVSHENLSDHVYLHLLESAPINKGHAKLYTGVPGNLVAFLCKESFESGHGGNVVFEPKTRLFAHYEKTLGAQRITRTRMLIDTKEAYRLVIQYFPEFKYDRL